MRRQQSPHGNHKVDKADITHVGNHTQTRGLVKPLARRGCLCKAAVTAGILSTRFCKADRPLCPHTPPVLQEDSRPRGRTVPSNTPGAHGSRAHAHVHTREKKKTSLNGCSPAHRCPYVRMHKRLPCTGGRRSHRSAPQRGLSLLSPPPPAPPHGPLPRYRCRRRQQQQ